jgi:hypothetical protein
MSAPHSALQLPKEDLKEIPNDRDFIEYELKEHLVRDGKEGVQNGRSFKTWAPV